MVRRQFEEQLSELKELLTKMGELNCEAIEDAVTALETQDTELARQTKGVETLVDEKEQQIERLCLKIIVKQQPVASDLLFVTSAMKMITDMERIADQAVDISELVIKMSRLPYADAVAEISDMAERVQEMVRDGGKVLCRAGRRPRQSGLPRGRRRGRSVRSDQEKADGHRASGRSRGTTTANRRWICLWSQSIWKRSATTLRTSPNG